jgi:hypothetical protein
LICSIVAPGLSVCLKFVRDPAKALAAAHACETFFSALALLTLVPGLDVPQPVSSAMAAPAAIDPARIGCGLDTGGPFPKWNAAGNPAARKSDHCLPETRAWASSGEGDTYC